MTDYFKTRTPREQVLIAGLAGLMAFFAVWQFAVKPVLTMKSDAARAQTAALRDYNIVRSGAPLMAANSGTSAGAAPFDRSAIVTLAGASNMPISRLQNESGGALKVWFEDVDSGQVFAFLSGLTDGYAATIEGVQLSKRSDGRVSAQITLRAL